MASRAEKLRNKKASRGRPKLEGVAREPSGKVSRSGIRHDAADDLLLDVRVKKIQETMPKHMWIDERQARDQKAGSFIGYLNIIGRHDGLSDDQYEGAMKFLGLWNEYLRSIKAPNSALESDVPGNPGDHVSEVYEEWCAAVRDEWKECRKAIQTAQNESRENLWAAIDLCILHDGWHHHMVGALRIVCNAFCKFFRI